MHWIIESFPYYYNVTVLYTATAFQQKNQTVYIYIYIYLIFYITFNKTIVHVQSIVKILMNNVS